MKYFYSKRYDFGGGLPLNDVHGFVLDRPTRTRDALVARHGVAADAFVEAAPVDVADLAAVHEAALVAALQRSGGIAQAVELPLLRLLPDFLARRAVLAPQLAAAGGTRDALAHAVDGGWAINLAGGFHHARPDRAHGFCLLNDVALAIHALRARGVRPRVAIVDLDAHQGDGNAAAFADDADVFTLSVHERGLFPHPKLVSSVDVGLYAGTDDDGFAEAVEAGLAALRKMVTPDVVIYVAGVDPHVDDPLSSLRVSAAGLVRRDARVARFAKDAGAGLVVVPAGGYTRASPLLSAGGMAAIAALAP